MDSSNPAVLKQLGGMKRDKKRTEQEINDLLVLIPKTTR